MIDTLVYHTLPGLLGQLSFLAYLLVFLGGVLTSLGPCNLSMVPVIMSYVGGQQDCPRGRSLRLSLLFTLGTSLTFVALGLFAAFVGGIFGHQKAVLAWIVAAVCFLLGLNLLGAIQLNLGFLARLQPTRVSRTGSLGALLLGLVMGLVGSQCATPVLAAILLVVMAKGTLLQGAVLLFLYGLGRGVPIVLVGTYTGVLRALPAMERWTRWSERVAGVLIIGVGLYFLWTA